MSEGVIIKVGIDGLKVTEGLKSLKNAVRASTNQMKAEMAAFDRAGDSIGKLDAKYRGLKRTIQAQDLEVKKLMESYKVAAAGGRENSAAALKYANQINNVTRKQEAYRKQLKLTENELKNVAHEMSITGQASKALDRISANAAKASEKLTALGQKATIGITLPVGGLLAGGAKSYLDFNNELIKMKSLLNNGKTSVMQLNQEINVLGKDSQKWAQAYGQSTTQVNAGMEELVKKGYTYNQVIGAMPVLLNAARGSGDDFNTVMSEITSTLEQYNLKSKNTQVMMQNTRRVADDLTFVANKTAAGFDDMGTAMSYVGPVAHSVGYTIEDTAAAIGLLSNNGILADKAGTQLRMAITRMLKPSKAAAAAFKEMGLSSKKMKEGFYSLPDLIQTINKHTKNLTKAEKAHLVAQAFGTRSQTGINILLTQGADKLRKLSKEEQNATGYTKKLSDEMGKSAELKVKKLVSSFHVMEQEIGKELVPEIIPLIKHVTHLIKEFGDLSDTQKHNIIDIALFAAGLGPAALLVGGFTKSISLLSKGLGGTFKLMSRLGSVTKVEAAGGLAVAGEEAGGLAGALGLLTGPVGLAIAGATALGIGVYAYAKHQQKANEVSLKSVDASQKQYESNKTLIQSYLNLRDKAGLTNQQLGRYLDLQDKIKSTTDANKIKSYKDAMGKLYKESGLSNDQFQRMLDLNGKLIKKIPKASTTMSKQGNIIVDNTDKLKKLNHAYLDKAIQKALIERQKALKEQPKLIDKIHQKQQVVNMDMKQTEAAHKAVINYNQKEVDQQIKKIKHKLKYNALMPQEKSALEGQLKTLQHQKQVDQDIYTRSLEKLQKDKDSLDNLKKQSGQIDKINKKISTLILENAGVNKKIAEQNSGHGKGLSFIDEQIRKLQLKKSKMESTTPVAQRNNKQFRDAVANIQNQISGLRNARTQISENTNAMKYFNQQAAKRIRKEISESVHVSYTHSGNVSSNMGEYRALRKMQGFASGTKSAPGGLAWVGEKGPELMYVPHKARIWTHDQSTKIGEQLKNLNHYASGVGNIGLTSNSRAIQMMQQASGHLSGNRASQSQTDMTQTNKLLVSLIDMLRSKPNVTIHNNGQTVTEHTILRGLRQGEMLYGG